MATVKVGGRPSTETAASPKIEDIKSTAGALHVNMVSLISGENQALGVMETIDGGNEYVDGTPVTSGTDVVLGSTGAAGDFLDTVVVRAVGTTGVSSIEIRDGANAIAAFTTTVADNSAVTIVVKAKSKTGSWRLRVTATTIANVRYFAKGLFT